MTIKWDQPSYNGGFAITQVNVYINNDPPKVLNQSINTYAITDLTVGETLKVQISAVNEVGEGPKSVASSLLFANVPSAPEITLIPTAGDINTILVSWKAPADENGDSASGYKVYLDNGLGGPFNLIFDGSAFPSRFSFLAGETTELLTCGRLYQARVTALNVAGESDSDTVSVYLGNVPSNPKSPRML